MFSVIMVVWYYSSSVHIPRVGVFFQIIKGGNVRMKIRDHRIQDGQGGKYALEGGDVYWKVERQINRRSRDVSNKKIRKE